MSDLVLYEKHLRETIFTSLSNNPDPDFIIDLLSLIPVDSNVNGAVYQPEDFVTLKESFHSEMTVDWKTCSNVVFVVAMLRIGLKTFQIPLTKARNWRPITMKYQRLVMAI